MEMQELHWQQQQQHQKAMDAPMKKDTIRATPVMQTDGPSTSTEMNQGGQGLMVEQVIKSNLPESLKQKLASLTPDQLQQVMQRIQKNPNQYAARINGLQNRGLEVMQQDMGGRQIGNQQRPMQGMPSNMSNTSMTPDTFQTTYIRPRDERQ
jgi:hypothetical protein